MSTFTAYGWLIAPLALALNGCAASPPRDEMLVGVWIAPRMVVRQYGQNEDAAEDAALREPKNTFQNVYRADHTWWGARLGKPPDVRGWWRIEGDELIRGIQQGRKPRTDRRGDGYV
jgi:hypothetical protein